MASAKKRSANEKVPVLIVGAGPAGLTHALALARYGVRSTVLCRYPGQAHNPRAHITNQRTLEIFSDLGVYEAVAAIGYRFEDMPHNPFVLSLAGPEVARTTAWGGGLKDFPRYRAASPHVSLNVAQHKLEPVLASAALATGLVDLRYSTEFIELEQDDHEVRAHVVDHNTGLASVITAQYLIGADGGRSQVLEQAGLSVRGPVGMGRVVYAWVEVDLTKYVGHRPGAIYWSVDPFTYGSWIMVEPWNQWVVGVHVDEDYVFDPQDTDELVAQIRHSIGDPFIDVKVKLVSPWAQNNAAADVYSCGRVLCMGDAVHRHPPTNGLGSNTSVADGYNLAWKLKLVLDGVAGPGLLDSYTAERAPVGRQVVDRAWKSFTEIFTLGEAIGIRPEMPDEDKWRIVRSLDEDTEEGADRRRVVRSFLDKLPYHFNALGVELGYRYSSPAVVPDDGDLPDHRTTDELTYVPSTSPGEHMPHVWLERSRQRISSQQLVGQGRFALITGRGGASWAEAAERARKVFGLPIDVCEIGTAHGYRDPLGDWERLRQIDDDGCLLVRPDGHIAWRSRTAAGTDRLIEVLGQVLDRPVPNDRSVGEAQPELAHASSS
jgi:2,4-dichlorophenol 6-monooxygenase